MELIRSLKKVLKENSYSRFWFRLGMAAFVLTPFLVYALHFDRTSEMDVFIATRFSGDTITDVYQVGMGRDRYRRFEINGDDFHSYPIRVTNYGTDTLIIKGASIWKEENSKCFKIESRGRQIEYQQSDQWINMKIEMIVFMTIIFGWTIAVTFLVTIKLGEGNDAQQNI